MEVENEVDEWFSEATPPKETIAEMVPQRDQAMPTPAEHAVWKPSEADEEAPHTSSMWQRTSGGKDDDGSAMRLVQSIGMVVTVDANSSTRPAEDQLWGHVGKNLRRVKEEECDDKEGDLSSYNVIEKPGIREPDGIKPISQIDEEHAEFRKQNDIWTGADGTVIVPSLIRLAIPEEASEANKDFELLQSIQPPPPPVELKDIQRTIKDENGKDCINVVWVRE